MNLAKLFKLPKKLGDSLLISLINNMVDYLRNYDRGIKVDDDGFIHLAANNLYLEGNGTDINIYSDNSFFIHSNAVVYIQSANGNEISLDSDSSMSLYSNNDGDISLNSSGDIYLNSDGHIYINNGDGDNTDITPFVPIRSEINISVNTTVDDIKMYVTTVFGTQIINITNSTQSISIIYDANNPYVMISFSGKGGSPYSGNGSATFNKMDGYDMTMNINSSLVIPNIESIDLIYINESYCYTADTLITLADGSTKQVKDITYEDELKVWNFDDGKDDVAKPLWIKRTEYAKSYQLVTFSDGNTIKLCGSDGRYHCMFDVTEQKFNHAVDCIGHEVYTENGIVTVISIEEVKEKVDHYNIVTNYHMNLYANHILTSTEKNNIYPIADMKFVKDDRNIVPYEEFEKAHISREYYDGWRAGEWSEPLKDVITHLHRRKVYAKPQKRVKNGLRTDYFG